MSYSLGALGATQYVIPSGGTFTGMFNVRGLQTGGAAAAASALGVEVRTIRGVSFNYVGWGSERDAGSIVAKGIVSSDTVPGVLLGKLRDAAVRAKARIPGSVTIDTTLRHVPTISREEIPTAPTTPATPTPDTAFVSEPFTFLGLPIWAVGALGVGALAIVLLLTRKRKAPALATAPAVPALTQNRRRRSIHRNYSFNTWRSRRRSALPLLHRVN